MKKYIAFLLCLIIFLSLFSCNNKSIENIDNNSNNDTGTALDTSNDPTTNTTSANYESILKIYRLIVEKISVVNQNPQALIFELGIQDESEKETFWRLYSSVHQFYPGREQEESLSPHYKLQYGYTQKDLNGDSVEELVLLTDDYRIVAVYSLANGTPVLLGSYIKEDSGWMYRNWIDSEGRIHVIRTDGGDIYHHSVSKISNGELLILCTYGYDVFRENGEIIGSLYQTVNENTTFITEQDIDELNRQYGNPLDVDEAENITKNSAGLTFTSLYTEAEIAMEMYEETLSGLGSYRTPYSGIPLCECENLGYAYVDIDGDSVNELIIDCGDTLILRYYEGTVHFYEFIFRSLYYLKTDGSYAWNHTGSNFEYGESQIYFEGAELKTKELYRIVNDGEPNAEYYIDGKQVTQEEILKYFEDNPKPKVEFLPLDVSWLSKISRSEAITLAENYWGNFNIEENRYIIGIGNNSWAPSSVYVVLLKYFVVDHYSTIDEIWIDKNTGEAIIPYAPDGKG